MTLVWTPDYAAVDPNFASVSLLLHGDGTNGSTSIVDSSPTPKTVSVFGDAQISTAQSKFGGGSVSFASTGYLTVASNQSFNFGGQDFTVECWVRLNSLTPFAAIAGVWDGTANGSSWLFSQGETANPARLRFGVSVGGSTSFVVSTVNGLFVNSWNHAAVVRSGNQLLMFSDGINVYSGSLTGSINSPSTLLSINSVSTGAFRSSQFLDDLRITKGVARYTSNFTPPAAPFPDCSPTTRSTAVTTPGKVLLRNTYIPPS